MSKKILAPLENLNYKPIKIRNHKFLTGFIFLIIFLLVFGFLIFLKTEKVKAAPDTTTLRPSADGDLLQLSIYPASPATHFDKVDEATSDGDTTYVKYSDTAAQETKRDLYNLPEIPSGSIINSVTTYIVVRNDVSGRGNYATTIKTNATVYDGTTYSPSLLAWNTYSTTYTTNPNTGAAWTVAQIDALQIGVKMMGEYDAGAGTYLAGRCTQVYAVVDYTPPPTVSTQDATNLCSIYANLNGNITDTGGATVVERGFEWGTTSGGPYPNSWTEIGSFGTGAFSSYIGFSPNTTYYFRAKARNSAGWGYGGEKSFTTGSPPNLYGFAWSDKIGWISFNSKNCDTDNNGYIDSGACGGDNTTTPVKPYGVYLPKYGGPNNDDPNAQRNFCGYAWSDKIGWIRFDPPDAGSTGLFPNYCVANPAYLLSGTLVEGLVRACAGAANSDCTGGANPAAGGWDGWICLDGIGAQPYQVTFDNTPASPTYNQFFGWAWGGGGTSTQNAVVGWISFNCSNRGVCTAATAEGGPSNYKVTYQPANTAPTVSNAQLDGTPNYCAYTRDANGVQKGYIGLKWTYNDYDGDDQASYWLQVATDSSFAPASLVINCEVPDPIVVNPNTDTTITSGVEVVATPSNVCNDGGLQGDRTRQVSYNGTYYWRVKSKAATGDTSWSTNWATDPSSFTTPVHAYPYIDFHWDPQYPSAYQSVNFYDDSLAYGGAAKSSWSWVFTDATPSSSILQNPTGIKFTSAGSKSVSLTVEDSTGAATADPNDFKCTGSKTIQVNLPLPTWQEIPPTF